MRNRRAWWLAVLVVPVVVAAAVLAGLALVPSSAPASLQAAETTAVDWGHARQAELTGAGLAQQDHFGNSVALSASGSTALVGAPFHTAAGAAFVFTLRHGVWSQTAKLSGAHAAANGQFGFSVALSASGSTALVGGLGAAYVFTLRDGAWSQVAKLTVSHGSNFGASVALSAAGDLALVGAPNQSVSGAFQAGASYVFTLRNGSWSQAAELTLSHPASTDDFGSSVALSADGTALVGAFGRNPGGAAYVFTPRHGTWTQTAELTASNASTDDWFGWSVALSSAGIIAMVGAPDHTVGNSLGGGEAYVFALRHGTWTQTAELTSAQEAVGGQFGNSVALSAAGGTALVGAPGGDPAPGSDTPSGAAYVFTLGHGGWSQAFGVAGPQTGTRDAFGLSAALSAAGGTALIGSPFYIGLTGTAYVFTGSGA